MNKHSEHLKYASALVLMKQQPELVKEAFPKLNPEIFKQLFGKVKGGFGSAGRGIGRFFEDATEYSRTADSGIDDFFRRYMYNPYAITGYGALTAIPNHAVGKREGKREGLEMGFRGGANRAEELMKEQSPFTRFTDLLREPENRFDLSDAAQDTGRGSAYRLFKDRPELFKSGSEENPFVKDAFVGTALKMLGRGITRGVNKLMPSRMYNVPKSKSVYTGADGKVLPMLDNDTARAVGGVSLGFGGLGFGAGMLPGYLGGRHQGYNRGGMDALSYANQGLYNTYGGMGGRWRGLIGGARPGSQMLMDIANQHFR